MSVSTEGIPSGLHPPVEVALAKALKVLPAANALPGQMCFEPKWDGYRVLIFRQEGQTSLWSRQGKDLTRYFPELEAAATKMIPPGCVVDGEAVIWSGGRLNFEALQERLSAGRAKLPTMVRELPASFAAFDVLSVAGHDTRSLPLRDRRALLEELAASWSPPLFVSPLTTDRDLALQWFQDLGNAGLEGPVVNSLLNERVDAVQEGGVWCEDVWRYPCWRAASPPTGGREVRGGDQGDSVACPKPSMSERFVH